MNDEHVLMLHIYESLPVSGPFPGFSLPLVRIRLLSFLALNFRHKALELLLVRLVLGLFDAQILPRHKVGILAQFAHRTLALLLVLLLELRQLRPLAVVVVVLVRVVRLLKLGDKRLDGKRAMVVEFQRPAGELCQAHHALQLGCELVASFVERGREAAAAGFAIQMFRDGKTLRKCL